MDLQDRLTKLEVENARLEKELDDANYLLQNLNGQLGPILPRSRDITDRQVVEQALMESEERYRLLVQLCPLAIGVHKENKITFINRAAVMLLGAECEEDVVGRSISDFTHPDDLIQLAKVLKPVEGMLEYRILDLLGNVLDIDARSILLQDGSSLIILQDVTTRKKVDSIMKDSEQYYRRLVELSPLSIGTLQKDELIYLNPAGLELIGMQSLDDVLGRSIYNIMSLESKRKVLDYKKNLLQDNKQPPIEIEISTNGGVKIDVEVIGSYDAHNNMTQFMIHNITERSKSKEALRKSEERYFLLQSSLDRFSKEVFGIVSISELENRLVKEVQKILDTEFVTIVEWSTNIGLTTRFGDRGLTTVQEETILHLEPDQLLQNELIAVDQHWIIKIGESRGKHILLFIGETSKLNHNSQHVWLRTLTRYVNVLYDNFHVIEELSVELKEFVHNPKAPPWLLRIFFNLSENERKRLSQDLHDSALQEQIVWYRNLDLLNQTSGLSSETNQKITNIMEGLLDVIYQIRDTCNELRPPLLKELGLVSSLRSLFDTTQLRSDFVITFIPEFSNEVMDDELSLGIYRIFQELLANAAKHARAREINLRLLSLEGNIVLTYEDNGVGMKEGTLDKSYGSMGIYGIRERVRSLNGTIRFHSDPDEGLKVWVSIPISFNDGSNPIELGSEKYKDIYKVEVK